MVSLRLSQLVAKKMVNQNPNREKNQTIGCIVNLSSIADRMILPESFAYSICSAAVNQLTKSMGVALAGQGIRVNAVAPGPILAPDNVKVSDYVEKSGNLSLIHI